RKAPQLLDFMSNFWGAVQDGRFDISDNDLILTYLFQYDTTLLGHLKVKGYDMREFRQMANKTLAEIEEVYQSKKTEKSNMLNSYKWS
ncbi:hypothetical protein, partial [Streptococcus sp. zg-JUN1979]|uniref:hypothetical protein n=1 Tax=Streptococcus sp. zg-JUN1979 TaxID=3391450 RepID=UPI0039AF94B1